MNRLNITYDPAFKNKIIKGAGMYKGQGGLLYDTATQKPIKDVDGELIKYDDFAGYQKGSRHVFKNDLVSIVKTLRKIR